MKNVVYSGLIGYGIGYGIGYATNYQDYSLRLSNIVYIGLNQIQFYMDPSKQVGRQLIPQYVKVEDNEANIKYLEISPIVKQYNIKISSLKDSALNCMGVVFGVYSFYINTPKVSAALGVVMSMAEILFDYIMPPIIDVEPITNVQPIIDLEPITEVMNTEIYTG
jgi:hypothetical protein